MPVGLVGSFFNQINHELAENNFRLLMASPAFEVPQGTTGFEVLSSEESTLLFLPAGLPGLRLSVCGIEQVFVSLPLQRS